jgi:predicted nucleic acid-binding protein
VTEVSCKLQNLEVASPLQKYGLKRTVEDEIDAICSLGMVLNPLDESVIRRAGEIHQGTGMHPYDCVHIATMQKLGITEILSADKDFDKIFGIRRIDLKSYATKT